MSVYPWEIKKIKKCASAWYRKLLMISRIYVCLCWSRSEKVCVCLSIVCTEILVVIRVARLAFLKPTFTNLASFESSWLLFFGLAFFIKVGFILALFHVVGFFSKKLAFWLFFGFFQKFLHLKSKISSICHGCDIHFKLLSPTFTPQKHQN